MSVTRVGITVRLLGMLVLIFLAVPILIIFPLALSPSDYLTFPPQGLSLRWIREVLGNQDWVASLQVSLVVALMTTVLALALAVAAATALTRADFPATQVIYAIILLPMIIPGIISAIAIYFFMSGAGLGGTLIGIAIGHTTSAIPVAVIILSATLQGFDIRMEQAALSLGASRMTTFRRVTLPLVAPGVGAAAIFAFLASFDELLISLFMAGPGQQTLPVRIWAAVFFQLDPTIAAVSALLVVISVAALAATMLLQRRARA